MTTAEVIVEVGFTAPSTGLYSHLDDASRGLLDTATLAPDGIWIQVPGYVMSVATRRGATRADGPNLRYEAGSATVVFTDAERRFDPTNLDGPYVSAGVTQVEPMRPIRVRATWDGVTYNVWRGYVDEWKIEYRNDADAIVTATCFDAFTVFASFDRNESGSVGAGETSGARIGRVLDSIDWGDTDRVIATGLSTLQATTLADNTLTELLLTADSELGEFYIDAEGRAVFRDRHAILTETRSNTSQATFGDDGVELRYSSINVDYSRSSIYNVVSIAREGGTAQRVEDSASVDEYLTRTYTRTDLLVQTDAESLAHANFLLGQAAQPELRFAEMEISPRRDADDDGALFEQALGRQFGDRVTVLRRPPGGGDPIERDVFIRGVEHKISEGATDWTTTFVLQSASRFDFLVLDSPTLGALDSDRLAY